jgi:lysophospholipase
MKPYPCRLGILCAWFLLILYSPTAIAELDNRYDLIRDTNTKEEEFEQRFKEKVETYWQENGKKGSFAGVDGINIHYMTFIHENEVGAIVISTGRTDSYIKYKELVFDLSRQRYSVYIHDHRGQGFSDRILRDERQKGHVDKFDDYVTDLDTFVKTVVRSKPHHRLFVLGHSMGGGIATLYIETYPDVFDAAALSAPMHEPDATILFSAPSSCLWFRWTDWFCPKCWPGFSDKPYTATEFKEDNGYTHSKVRYKLFRTKMYENEKLQLGGPTRRWCGEACAASSRMLENTSKIRIPVLVLQAGVDTAVTPEGQNRFCENLQKETGKACHGGRPRRIDGAYHDLLIETDTYRIPAVSAILDFFSEVKPAVK